MQFIVVNNDRGDAKHYFYVHKRGCRDIVMQSKQLSSGHFWAIDGEFKSVEVAIAKAVEGFHLDDQGYSGEDFYISPCAKK